MPPTRLHRLKSQAGAALVLVLSTLVLLSIVALAYLASTSLERASSQSYSDGAKTRMLADIALEIVKGQIWAATTETNPGGATSWASQPGAIRTFTAGQTNPTNVYKLYSSDAMVVRNTNFVVSNEIANGWANIPDSYVDLNRPVIAVSGGTTNTNYPIVDPAATNVVGFSYQQGGNAGATASAIPMPVQWLYLLQDGSITNASIISNGTVNTNLVPSTNPVIGRIAFWTDDDTCKLNINTACGASIGRHPTNTNIVLKSSSDFPPPYDEGAFWDTPRAAYNGEYFLGGAQPSQKEYQRYPGHPARLSLRTVFTNLTPDQIFAMSPKYASDVLGSRGGQNDRTKAGVVFNGISLTNNNSRLYASLDEILFSTNRITNSPLTTNQIRQSQFFLTSYNRAPELNVFGKPRISIWPQWSSNLASRRTAIDKWFANCSTISNASIGATAFYFARQNSQSPAEDWNSIPRNQSLFAFLTNTASQTFPGYTGNFDTKFGSSNLHQLTTEIFDYIRCVNIADAQSNSYVYALGTTNAGLRGSDFANLPNNGYWGFGQVVPIQIGNSRGFGRFMTITEATLQFFPLLWSENIVAKKVGTKWTYDPNTIYAIRNGELSLSQQPNLYQNNLNHTNAALFRCVLHLEISGVSERFPIYVPDFNVNITSFSGGWTATPNGGTPVNIIFPTGTKHVNYGRDNDGLVQRGGISGGLSHILRDNSNTSVSAGPPNWPFFSDPFPLSGTIQTNVYTNSLVNTNGTTNILNTPPSSFSFSGGTVRGNISVGTNTVQNFAFQFPSTILPTPLKTLPLGAVLEVRNQPTTGENKLSLSANGTAYLKYRIKFGPESGERIVSADDVTISVEPQGAATDTRWLMAQRDINASNFSKHSNYDNLSTFMNPASYDNVHLNNLTSPTTNYPVTVNTIFYQTHPLFGNTTTNNIPHAHTLRDPYSDFAGQPLYSQFGIVSSRPGSYQPTNINISLPKANYGGGYWDISSSITNGVTNAQGKPGDYDTGIGVACDGPYINAPDEGSVFFGTSAARQNPYFPSASRAAQAVSDTYFAPNRVIPSSGMLGSLPTRLKSDEVFETLVFSPNPRDSSHRGLISPPDYLWMDLFNMPIVEPYAISEPFSTAGKVNLNYQIVPFDYIKRSTAQRAVIAPNMLTAVTNISSTYKYVDNQLVNRPGTMRFPIHADQTLRQFDEKFTNNTIFRNAAEIASVWLYPSQITNAANLFTNTLSSDTNGTRTAISNWWHAPGTAASPNYRTSTADNLREQPYTSLYQNLTTQANTYTTHVFVQSLTQNPTGKLVAGGEWRGSFALERFLDPNNPTLPDFAAPNSPNAMGFYQFRVNNTKQFLP